MLLLRFIRVGFSVCAQITRNAVDEYYSHEVFGRPFVKRFAVCCWTVVLSVLSVCLSVTLVHCGETVGSWIKMKLGMEVGLGPDHIVLDGYPALLKRGTVPNFRSVSIVAKRLPISATAKDLWERIYGTRNLLKFGSRIYNFSSLSGRFAGCCRGKSKSILFRVRKLFSVGGFLRP